VIPSPSFESYAPFQPYWGITVSSTTYNGASVGGSTSNAIVDTGTTLIYIPSATYTKFASASGGRTDSSTGLLKYTTKPTGNFAFTIGGKSFALTPAQYLIPAAEAANFGVPSSGYYSYIADGGSSGVNLIVGESRLSLEYDASEPNTSLAFRPEVPRELLLGLRHYQQREFRLSLSSTMLPRLICLSPN
jgi:hypothetical protein